MDTTPNYQTEYATTSGGDGRGGAQRIAAIMRALKNTFVSCAISKCPRSATHTDGATVVCRDHRDRQPLTIDAAREKLNRISR